MKRLAGLVMLLCCSASIGRAQALAAVRSAGHLDCATVQNAADWSEEEYHGNLSALGGEICRAVGAAILGGGEAAVVHPYPDEGAALAALQSGAVQLAVGLSPAAQLATRYGVAYGRPVFFDTQRFLVLQQSGIAGIAGLRDKLICAMANTTPERVLRDVMTARSIPYGVQAHSEEGEMDAAVGVGRCAAGTALESRLAEARAGFPAGAAEFVFLPERIGLDPVVPAYRYGDQDFGLIVDWTVSALVEAEALGITQANVGEAMQRKDVAAVRLLGGDFAVAQGLGIARDWAAKVIGTTGNYEEVFERTVGKVYGLERGYNALWTQGGLMFPLPMQ